MIKPHLSHDELIRVQSSSGLGPGSDNAQEMPEVTVYIVLL